MQSALQVSYFEKDKEKHLSLNGIKDNASCSKASTRAANHVFVLWETQVFSSFLNAVYLGLQVYRTYIDKIMPPTGKHHNE